MDITFMSFAEAHFNRHICTHVLLQCVFRYNRALKTGELNHERNKSFEKYTTPSQGVHFSLCPSEKVII